MAHQPHRPIFQVINDRSAATLIPILNHYIKRRSVVTTDSWRAYHGLGQRFVHRTVNHTRNFVHPVTGTYNPFKILMTDMTTNLHNILVKYSF